VDQPPRLRDGRSAWCAASRRFVFCSVSIDSCWSAVHCRIHIGAILKRFCRAVSSHPGTRTISWMVPSWQRIHGRKQDLRDRRRSVYCFQSNDSTRVFQASGDHHRRQWVHAFRIH
jgi:hypothetical protein